VVLHRANHCASLLPFNPHRTLAFPLSHPRRRHLPPSTFLFLYPVRKRRRNTPVQHRLHLAMAPPLKAAPRRVEGTRSFASSPSTSWRKESPRNLSVRPQIRRFRLQVRRENRRIPAALVLLRPNQAHPRVPRVKAHPRRRLLRPGSFGILRSTLDCELRHGCPYLRSPPLFASKCRVPSLNPNQGH
jgi:hypothetical protein